MSRLHSLPAELYTLVEHSPATVLLECATPSAPDTHDQSQPSPCTRLFTAPLRICVANQAAELPLLFSEIEGAVAAGHYAAGFFTYECGSFFEPTAALRPSRAGQPLAWFGIYDRPWLFDHLTGAFRDGDPPALAQFSLHARAATQNQDNHPIADPVLDCALDLTEEQYAERIAAIHELIRAGDIYQLNFTVPLRVNPSGSLAGLYRCLRSRQPVPYGAFLHWRANRRILSFSPELFFRLEDRRLDDHGPARRITTRPMKGTAPRGRTTREDRDLAEWLRNDPKNRSENVMIVDLLRNDLGRLCTFGSVSVENLFAVERYPTLWQMTSTVTGALRLEVTFQQIFRALFPCGSVTGAPKVRAMQLLAKIEPQPRGVYTGAIGFFSKQQTVFSVAIRTLELEGQSGELDSGQGTMGVGSGIVIDSDAAGEFRECLLKAEFLTRLQKNASHPSPDSFSLVETLLWHNEYPFIELHLDRLEDSARYFGFPCDRAKARAALIEHAGSFAAEKSDANREPRRVRLLLNSGGDLKIADEVLTERPSAGNAQVVRVCIASQRTDSSDRMLFHKTTCRPLYAQALQAAVQAGFDDVLFLNNRGEVTEGAIHNVFIEKDGRWSTPPTECGLLAGVHRRHILESQSGVEERVFSIDDLRKADGIYLSNAVRGLRRAVIEWQD